MQFIMFDIISLILDPKSQFSCSLNWNQNASLLHHNVIKQFLSIPNYMHLWPPLKLRILGNWGMYWCLPRKHLQWTVNKQKVNRNFAATVVNSQETVLQVPSSFSEETWTATGMTDTPHCWAQYEQLYNVQNNGTVCVVV